jgi:hypothetical protein
MFEILKVNDCYRAQQDRLCCILQLHFVNILHSLKLTAYYGQILKLHKCIIHSF